MTPSVRAARPTDAGRLGDILWRAQIEEDWMPMVYSGAETIAFCGAMIDRGWVVVAESEGRPLGFLARDGEEICALYVQGEARGRGLGRQLLDHAKSDSARLHLRTPEANLRARQFYARAGFVEAGRGSGADSDANLPDIHYVWTRGEAEA